MVKVSHSTIARWVKDSSSKAYNNTKRTEFSKAFIISETLRAIVKTNPIVTHKEMKDNIFKTFNFTVSSSLIRTVLRLNLLTRKKARFFGLATKQESTTSVFVGRREQFIQEGRLFFSLDETSFGRHGFLRSPHTDTHTKVNNSESRKRCLV